MDYMKYALDQANKAAQHDFVPVGAVIVMDDEIISQAHNMRDKTNGIHDHAEILAINIAAQKLGSWKMPGAIMYVTMEPCDMCKAAIKQARITDVIYGAPSNKEVNYKTTFTLDESKECGDIVTNYFKAKR